MKRFFFLGLAIFFCTLQSSAQSSNFKGMVEIERARSLYVDWDKAQAGKPTLVLLNGLTYATADWDAFTVELRKFGFGVLRYDPIGMGKTLETTGAVQTVIRIEDQARDLDLLTKALGLTGRLNIVGLSYGGGLAIAFAKDYANRIEHAILMAPFTEPLHQQDANIRAQIAWTRATFPMNSMSDEELYAYFLRQNVYYVYPLTEPSMLRSPLKPEAVFQMTQGIRQYDMKAASQNFPEHSVTLMVGANDQYIPRDTLIDFWNQIPAAAKLEMVIVPNSEHKIPEAQPKFAAEFLKRLLIGR